MIELCTMCVGTGYHTIWVPSGGEGPPVGVILKDEYVNANAICPYCHGKGLLLKENSRPGANMKASEGF